MLEPYKKKFVLWKNMLDPKDRNVPIIGQVQNQFDLDEIVANDHDTVYVKDEKNYYMYSDTQKTWFNEGHMRGHEFI